MGVYKLYSFMKDIGAFHKVKISEEVKDFRRHTNHTPVIAVDGINIMYWLHGNYKLPFMFGGHHKEYMKLLENFIEAFRNEGVELVFFFDGVNIVFTLDKWIHKKRETIKYLCDAFDKLEEGWNLAEIEKRKVFVPKTIWITTMFVLKKLRCKITFSMAECDRELALFAKQKNCMGILAADSDFIIFDTAKVYSSRKIDLLEMTFNIYDKRKLLEVLMLKSCELPLLASLIGNDYFPHPRYLKDSPKDLYMSCAKYIRGLNLRIRSDTLIGERDVKRIAWDVFKDNKALKLLQESLDFYNLKLFNDDEAAVIRNISDIKWKSIVKMLLDVNDDGPISLVTRLCYQESNTLEDFRCNDIPPVSDVLRPMRQKYYGIILYEKPGAKEVVEWVVDGYDNLSHDKIVTPIFPNVKHPGLMSIYKDGDKEVQWKMIEDIFNIDSKSAKSLREHLLIPALSFKYINDKELVNKQEMDSLIISSVIVSSLTAEELNSVTVDHVKSSRPIRIYNLVTSTFATVHNFFLVFKNLISLDNAAPSNYENGKLFHFILALSCVHNLSKEEVLMEVLKYFPNKNMLIDSWKEMVHSISVFIGL